MLSVVTCAPSPWSQLEDERTGDKILSLNGLNKASNPNNDTKMVPIVTEIKRLASFALLTVWCLCLHTCGAEDRPPDGSQTQPVVPKLGVPDPRGVTGGFTNLEGNEKKCVLFFLNE